VVVVSVEPIAPVVVGVVGEPADLPAVELAAREAAGRAAPLLVWWLGGPSDAAGRALGRAVVQARAAAPEVPVTVGRLRTDPVGDLLVAASSIVVLGQAGPFRSGWTAVSPAGRLLAGARTPVVVCSPGQTSTAPGQTGAAGPVLVAVGDPDTSEPVVAFAFAAAAWRGTGLIALRVWADPADASPARDGLRNEAVHSRAAADELLAGALAVWSEKCPDVPVRRAVRHALDVPVAVVAASRSAGLVVLGAPRRTGPAAGSLAGSVVDAVLRRASSAVAVVPTGSS
jgi:hypothetical protein